MSPFQGRWRLFTNLYFSGILNTLPERGSAAPPCYLAQNRAEIFLDFEHPIYQAVNAIANSPQKARSLSWNYDILSTRGRG